MKCVLIISAVYPPEPVVSARISSDLYHALKEKGHEVRVLHPIATRPYGFQFDEKVELGEDEVVTDSYTCPQSSLTGRLWESVSFGKACAKYIRQHHEEICVVYSCGWALFAQYQIARVCDKFGLPDVVPVQDMYPEALSNKLPSWIGNIVTTCFLPVDKYVLRHAAKIHAISEKMRDYLVRTRGVEKERFVVIINWQDETDFLEYHKGAEPEMHEKFTMMYMGNIGPVAGVDLLIEAFEAAQLKEARLVIAGSGSMKEPLKKQAAGNPNIEFWEVPNGKVPEIQAKADVMLLPIKKGAAGSSIPSKLPAYMFSAKPVIGCMDEDSDTANAIRESGGGVIVEPENAAKLAEIIKTVAAMDDNELQAMGERSREYGLQVFSKGINLSKLVNAIISVIK